MPVYNRNETIILFMYIKYAFTHYLMKFFANIGYKSFKINTMLMANPIIEITAIGIGYVIEPLGNVIKTLKIPPTITVSVCYYIS